jgi:small nuclear ribonucleoprotein (snRNP)-like protein
MLCNNILNFESEWPKDQESYNKYLLNKYGTYDKLNEVHHYETTLITDKAGRQIVPAGLEVPEDFSITFYDPTLKQTITRSSTFPVSNLIYEDRKETEKRSIFVLKDIYIGLVIDDIEEVMPYTPGSSQYVSDRVVRGENIRLYT